MDNGVLTINSDYNYLTSVNLINKKTLFLIVKTVFDIIIGIIGCLFILPIALIVKISYLISGDFSPIFYSQIRIGKNGKKFKIYKFRTMVPNADVVLKELLKQEKYRKEWEENQKLNDDPRITKVGRILRKTSLDEVPQFLNLFKDMSLIGPRPLVVGELDSHNGIHSVYESVKPGITGWWACNGRSATDYNKRLNLEYYYALNQSFSLDIKCLLKTVDVVINRTGAK